MGVKRKNADINLLEEEQERPPKIINLTSLREAVKIATTTTNVPTTLATPIPARQTVSLAGIATSNVFGNLKDADLPSRTSTPKPPSRSTTPNHVPAGSTTAQDRKKEPPGSPPVQRIAVPNTKFLGRLLEGVEITNARLMEETAAAAAAAVAGLHGDDHHRDVENAGGLMERQSGGSVGLGLNGRSVHIETREEAIKEIERLAELHGLSVVISVAGSAAPRKIRPLLDQQQQQRQVVIGAAPATGERVQPQLPKNRIVCTTNKAITGAEGADLVVKSPLVSPSMENRQRKRLVGEPADLMQTDDDRDGSREADVVVVPETRRGTLREGTGSPKVQQRKPATLSLLKLALGGIGAIPGGGGGAGGAGGGDDGGGV